METKHTKVQELIVQRASDTNIFSRFGILATINKMRYVNLDQEDYPPLTRTATRCAPKLRCSYDGLAARSRVRYADKYLHIEDSTVRNSARILMADPYSSMLRETYLLRENVMAFMETA